MVLRILGYGKVRNYSGSFGQWSRQEANPVER
jgi:3-mercaptopyruvate sulfurtransferase SseA